MSGSHLTLNMEHDTSIALDAKDGKLVGTQKHAGHGIELTGLPAPALKGHEPKAWTKPVKLFDGKDLSGWTPIGDTANSHWVVQDGVLLNENHGANLKSNEQFTDFKVHFEVNCPDDANSGFYLRGRRGANYLVILEHKGVITSLLPALPHDYSPGPWTAAPRHINVGHRTRFLRKTDRPPWSKR